MSEHPAPAPGPRPDPQPPQQPGQQAKQPARQPGGRKKMAPWLVRTIIGAAAAVVLVIAYLIASATLPLTWANAIKGQVGPNMGNAIWLGIFYGFVFTFVPVLIAWQARRRGMNLYVRLVLLVVSVLLFGPNLMTLAVLHGTSTAARNARAIWNTGGANWFGGWSEVFMVVGATAAVVAIILGRSWLKRGRELRKVHAAEKQARRNEADRARQAKEAARVAEKQARQEAKAARKSDGGTPGAGEPGA